LKLPSQPAHVVAFFPESLEKMLLAKELAYAKGKTEEQIQATWFSIKPRPGGGYEPEVTKQQ